ncbi:hypothetical protein OOK41_31585 [Micromonospora sp. NBC_01655]|uniref:hypothetical protein n=1 Tax=Micromonospora sp. NBC_01655 TaxID=2975983 RepID=UPI00224E1EFA|nr:hypothetical protein [Micromonospora sp. NBC_01655]MCX4474804.1 hypothetical protein [Micromonospora sp. NBC_01655]
MTSAPAPLLAVRQLLLQHLDINKGTARAADLDPAEVGIVGDPAHIGGYHCGSDRVRRVSGKVSDYSVVESPRDQAGLAGWACALDVGDWSVRVGGKTHDLRSFSLWLVAQCKAGTADTRDIREVIYSPDGKTVKRWDRLGRRTTGDSSHRWHTHISYFRDAIKAGRDQTAVYRRYLTTIGLIKAPTSKESTMTAAEFLAILKDPKVAAEMSRLPWAFVPAGFDGRTAHGIVLVDQTAALVTANNLATNADGRTLQILELLTGSGDQTAAEVAAALVAAGQDPAALAAALTALAGPGQARE